ncbi:U4/U6 small nuclear ribonucleoprotein Prp3 [Histomonas meleagridis]|uniref:U4/U6 small nuclear ribonucleoprotein Prp3 n=1 Tax=Histomonas meleagridis TaxID=135588 RepID=UPI00355AA228|nr:U4/U6 small nuclear ribonucleoprotein Prp3 [Histomonas meleagridis]KAH0799191.1 U4/U6 small nuclear ribonucleoprotein Prp3 [Histomonas meleagridis]
MDGVRLDQLKIKKFLEPWIDETSRKYPVLLEPVVRSIIISSAKKGSSLESQIQNFFPREKDLRHFLKKYNHAVRKFAQKDVNSFITSSEKRKTSPPRKYRQPRENPFRDHHSHQNVRPVEQNINLPPQTPTIPTNSSSPAPSYFLDSASVSLRKADQKIKPLLFNSEGKRVDEEGNLIKDEFVHRKVEVAKVPIDRRIPTVSRPLNRDFRFIEPGEIIQETEEKRNEFLVDMSVVNGLSIFDTIALARNFEKPFIDWWDLPFVELDDNNRPIVDDNGLWVPNYSTVNNEYENAAPVPFHKPIEKEVPTILTPKERKRLRHINKLNKQNEERLMIKLNLKPKEPSRIKMSQMIKLNGGKSVLTPTMVELEIKKNKEDRIQKHIEHNQAAKLTPEQRHDKNVSKRKADSEENVTITVFAIKNLNNPLHFAKLTSMGKKWFMTGGIFVVDHPQMSFVIAEAGPKGTRKYCALINQRIKWSETGSEAIMTFQGYTSRRHFYNFKKYKFDVATQCRKFCGENGCESLFDSASQVFNG